MKSGPFASPLDGNPGRIGAAGIVHPCTLSGFFSRQLSRSLSCFHSCLLPCFLAGILALAGCGEQPTHPHLILVIMDTTRHDRLGCGGHPSAGTPTLDSLATNGVRFASTIASTPVTAPAVTTILSGVLPPVHGVRDNGRFDLNPGLGLLAEAFAGAGYQTGAVIAAVPLLARFGFDRGFDHYDDSIGEDPYRSHDPRLIHAGVRPPDGQRRAKVVTDRALKWLSGAVRSKPVFLLAHYYDPHFPYDPPPAYAQRHTGDPYDGEVAYMDAEIGRLLAGAREVLGEDSDIRVVAVGDHGEGLNEHDEEHHGFFIYDATVKVPLIFSRGGSDSGRVVTEMVRAQDIAPTICHWCGVTPLATFDGVDLSPVLAGGAVPAACDTAFTETLWTQLRHGWSPLQGIRTGRWKWILAPRCELYDLAVDPGETQNLAGTRPEVQSVLSGRLDEMLALAAKQAPRLGASEGEVDPELDRQLRALGYVGDQDRSEVATDFTLPDPKDSNRQWMRERSRRRRVTTALRLYQRGQYGKALAELDLASAVRALDGRESALRGAVLAEAGRAAEALSAYVHALHTESDQDAAARTRLGLAEVLIDLEDVGAAAAHLDTLRALTDLPENVRDKLPELIAKIDSLR